MTRPIGAAARGLAIIVVALHLGCRGGASETMAELQRVTSGGLDVVLLSPHEALQHGKDTFVIEFRSNGTLEDVGNVRATATMPMPGMPMFGTIEVQRTEVLGRYAASGQFEMAGTWRFTLEWDGPHGKGSATFPGTVR